MAEGPYDYYDPDTPVEETPPLALPPLGDFTIPWSIEQSPFGNPAYQEAPVQTPPPTPQPGIDPRARTVANLLALLLGGGAAAGIGQSLFSKPQATQTIPRLSPQQLALLSGAQGQFGQTGGILQALLGALQSPQIPPGLSLLAEQAFQPQLGNLYSQATQAGRLRGFYDAPATSPPGGAILGPGLANLQGQMAQAKLNLYQNNIANMLQTLQGSQHLGQSQGQLAANLPTQTNVQPPRPSLLQSLVSASPVFEGIGQLLGAVNPKDTSAGKGLWATLSGLFGGNNA